MKNTATKKVLLSTICAFAVHASASGIASAQSIDYGSLESLFGEPVTTSATGKPQRSSEAPVTMEIISADDIRRSGAQEIPEILRQLSGVSVLQWTNQQHDVNVRGYNQAYSPRLLVLVNGRQAYLDDYGYTAWATIPVQLEEIRQIEVVKGPNTALFGFNAVSGVINIVTYNPLYDDESSAGITVGNHDYRKGHYVQSMKLNDKVGLRVSGGITESDSFDEAINGTDPASFIVNPVREVINLDGLAQVTENSQLRLEVSAGNVEQTEVTPQYSLSPVEYETKSFKASYEADTSWGLIKATAYKNMLDVAYRGTVTLLGDNEVTVVQLEDLFKVGTDHTFRILGEYRNNFLEGSFLPGGAELDYDVYALSGMWNWSINDSWEWTNALRVDYLELERSGPFLGTSPYVDNDFEREITELSYNSGIVWRASEEDTVRLGTSRGIQVPSLLEYGIEFALGPVTLVGNPGIDPTIVTNYELAWDRTVDAIDGIFRSAVFFQQTEDVKALSVNTLAGGVLQGDNIGDSDSVGAEFGLTGKVGDHWDWDVNYTVQTIDDDFPVNNVGSPFPVAKNFEETTPVSTLNAHVGYQKGPWEVDVFAYYLTDFDLLEPTGLGTYTADEIDSYLSVSGRVGYDINDKLTLAISGQEIQGGEAQRTTGPDVERRVFVSLTSKF